MRVLHIHSGKEGGAERFFVSLAGAMSDRGVEQRFVIRPGRSWGEDIAALGPVIQTENRLYARPFLRRRVAALVARWQPDAVLAWMPRAALLLPRRPGPVRATRLGDYPKKLDPFARADVLVGNTPDITESCRALGWTGRAETISNFVRPVAAKPVSRAEESTPEGAFLIVAGGRFVPLKGLDVAIRAAARVPGAWLWVLGDGPERAALQQLCCEVGIAQRTRFPGWKDEPIHHIAAGDAFVMPSRIEPLGNMALEAWQAGVPLVSTRSEGPSWFVRDGIDGLLAEIDDVEAIASHLRTLAGDPARRLTLARAGRARLRQMFGREAVVSAWLDLLGQR